MAYRTLLLQVHAPGVLQACPGECGHPRKEGSAPTCTNPGDSVTVTASVGGGGKEKEITSVQVAGAGGYCETQHYQLHNKAVDGEVVPLPTGAWPALSQSTASPGHQ